MTICPHCFNTIKNEYPHLGGDYQVLHYSEFVADLIAEGNLKPLVTIDTAMTYHDSCYLGRHNGVYDAPRKIAEAIPGLQLREMERCRDRGFCCGAGGGHMWMEESRGRRINHIRTDQFLETGGDTVGVSCPFCLQMFEEGIESSDSVPPVAHASQGSPRTPRREFGLTCSNTHRQLSSTYTWIGTTRGRNMVDSAEEQLTLLRSKESSSTGKDSSPRKRSKRKANDLDGRTWEKFSISIWSDIRKTREEQRLKHPAMFPIELVTRLIQCFTTTDDRVILDPFAGVGSTAIAAELMGKTGIGIDLSSEFCNIARLRNPTVSLEFDESTQLKKTALTGGSSLEPSDGSRKIIQDDARNLLQHVAANSVDLVVTSPPYWDILLRDRSADGKTIRHYGNNSDDLGRITDYNRFLEEIREVFLQVYQSIRPSKYCIVVVMDIRKKSDFYPFHSHIASILQTIGFIYDDLIIWDRRHEYNNMRPLGYPYKFRINKAHEFILIFQKPSE